MPGIERELCPHPGVPAHGGPAGDEPGGLRVDRRTQPGDPACRRPRRRRCPPRASCWRIFEKVQKEAIPRLRRQGDRGAAPGRAAAARARCAQERQIPEVGVTEWQLANGVKVVVKPTDFRNDQVLLRAFSPGGHSRVPDRDYRLGALRRRPGGGQRGGPLRPHRAAQRPRRQGGRRQPLHRGAGRGGHRPRLARRPRDPAPARLPVRDRPPRATRRSSPPPASSCASRCPPPRRPRDRVLGSLAGRALPQPSPPPARPICRCCPALSLDRALRVYRERFADAGDFTFVFVGRIEPARARAAGRALPGRAAEPGAQGVLARRGRAPPHRQPPLRGGGGGRAQEQRGPGASPARRRWSREEEQRLDTVTEALAIRLREVLREELGGTYGVEVSGDARPACRCRSSARTSGSPARRRTSTA